MRTTDQEQLRPPRTQERALEQVLWRGRTRDHVARAQRITAGRRGQVCSTRSQQEAELQALRAAFPE